MALINVELVTWREKQGIEFIKVPLVVGWDKSQPPDEQEFVLSVDRHQIRLSQKEMAKFMEQVQEERLSVK